MNNAKFLFLSVLLSFSALSQNRPGIDYFPHISFFDQYINAKFGVEAWGDKENNVLQRVKPVYEMMKAAGITHCVTFLDDYTSDTLINPGLKIYDRHIEWSEIESLPVEGTNNPGRYLLAQGLDTVENAFEIGESSSFTGSSLTKENNYGFGVAGGDTSSVWWMNVAPNMIPGWVTGKTGGRASDDLDTGGKKIKVRIGEVSAGGGYYLVYGIINRMMFTRNRQHFMWIKAKTDENNLPASTPVLTVRIRIKPYTYEMNPEDHFGRQLNFEDPATLRDSLLPDVVFQIPVTVKDFKGDGYHWIEVTHPLFRRSDAFNQVGKEMEIALYFENNIGVSIDRIAICDEDFREFYSNGTLRSEIESAINSKTGKYINHPLFESAYYDEPYMLTTKIRGDYQKMLRRGTNRERLDINGATGGAWNWNLAFDREMSKGEQFYKNYLLYDFYPLIRDIPKGYDDQARLQRAFDEMICYKGEPVLKYPGHDLDIMQHMGYLSAIEASQNYTSGIPGDDIPLFHTIQVAASQTIRYDGNGKYSYKPKFGELRAPTPEEVKAMSNLAIAYGAKGFMYYMVPTMVPMFRKPLVEGSEVLATYGLFDDAGRKYDDDSKEVCFSRGYAEQTGNDRYLAVKETITTIKSIEKYILRGNWINGFTSDHNGGKYRLDRGRKWISSISSRLLDKDIPDSIPYIEAGLFGYTNGLSGKERTFSPDTLLLYVVNKFCDDTDRDPTTHAVREVKVFIDVESVPFKRFKILNLSDSHNTEPGRFSQDRPGSSDYVKLQLSGGDAALLMIVKE